MKKIFLIFLLGIILFCFLSCKKEEKIGAEPLIHFVNISPLQVKEYQDKITITISYKDGDGDLGENNSSVKNLFVTDNRNGVSYEYRIQQLAPDNSVISIQGNLSIEINNTAIINGGSSETVNYSVYIKDRAKNKSNTITTDNITVVP